MPSRLFWALDSCIPRVLSEQDLRHISVIQATQTQEAMTSHRENLSLQLGEVYQVERSAMVQAEPGALNRLRQLAG